MHAFRLIALIASALILISDSNSQTLTNAEKTVSVRLDSIRITRDNWGVPHIYAPTDEEAAYGLVWAACEDDFHTIQENILAVRHRMGEVKGKDGAIMDFVTHIFDLERVVAEQIDTAFSPKFRKLLDASILAMNRYLELHPEEALVKYRSAFTVEELVQGYTMANLFMNSVEQELIQIFGGSPELHKQPLPEGSNAFAVRNTITEDGKTYLLVNSHQPLEGAYSWYEAHVTSGEGWNMLGGTFPGGATLFVGANEQLGWAHTLNHPDLTDVYRLEMHPKEKLKYRFDGEWLELEKRPLKIKVKVGIKLPVKRTFYKSVHGPVIKGKDGHFYAIRTVGLFDIRAPEQFYHMNKARNYPEFMQAMKLGYHSGMNTIYADQEHNIYYLSNGHLPRRNPAYNWKGVLPGDTSAVLWEPDWFPLEDMPQEFNPDCGYLYNTNNSPFMCTGDECDPDSLAFDRTMGFLITDDNRSIRFRQLIDQYETLSYADFKRIKYDVKGARPAYTYSAENIELLFSQDPEQHPELADVIGLLNQWDMEAKTDRIGASIAMLAMDYISGRILKQGAAYSVKSLPEDWYPKALRFAKRHLMKHFGTLHVPLGEIQKLQRGDVELPMYGMVDVISACWPQKWKNGKYRAYVGDSYIQFLRFDGTKVEIESINAYGARNRPESPHYTDQMPLFVKQQLKPMSLESDLAPDLIEEVYHPD